MDSEGNYDSDLGTDRLAKYAEMYGLGEKSGLEIDEASPHISDEYSIQSAIGQGNNNFTVSQINRYVTAVANKGTVYDLTLIDKITDSSGSLLRDNEAEVVRTMDDISQSTWDQLHEGMELMVSSHAHFPDWSSRWQERQEQHSRMNSIRTMRFLSDMHLPIHRKYLSQYVL